VTRSIASRAALSGLILLTLCNIFGAMDRGIITILIEPIKRELGLSDTVLGLLTGVAFQVIYMAAGFPLARFADRVSRKLVIASGLTFWSAMTALCGVAANGWQLLAARIGVGLGEAGGSAPSQALITDYFPTQRRAQALGIFNLGVTLGAPCGWLVGAFVGQAYGWRWAFLTAGLPGLLLALVLFVFLKEPDRRQTDAMQPVSFTVSARFLLSQRSFVLTLVAAFFFSFTYAANAWVPSFLSRVHGIPLRDVGIALATTHGVFGTLGIVGGGWLSSKLGKKDDRAGLWLAASACMVGSAPYLYFLFAEGALPGLGVPLTLIGLSGVYLLLASVWGPMMAVYQSVARADMRATAGAFYMVVSGLGLSLAPLIIGLLNDGLQLSLGVTAVRYSLLTAVAALPVAAACFLAASRYSQADMARANL